ncbi:MAG: hypothetical protein O2923_14610 [Verrucomicrobia bacterium]|nr:hypothetical protein [Verrucomicrobiota bacterium]MDA1088607.1 hypothetical protein [Verrucomicrobiota bacterium]
MKDIRYQIERFGRQFSAYVTPASVFGIMMIAFGVLVLLLPQILVLLIACALVALGVAFVVHGRERRHEFHVHQPPIRVQMRNVFYHIWP